MGGSFSGDGANWPLPSTWHSAMMSAMYRKWPERQDLWEKEHRHRKEKSDRKFGSSQLRFGGLKTWGPFPSLGRELIFPVPGDITRKEEGKDAVTISPEKVDSPNNAVLPLLAVNNAEPTKETPGQWISVDNLSAYLEGGEFRTTDNDVIFSVESRPGISIDRESGTARKGIFYSADYLRLREHVSMTAFAECRSRGSDGEEHDLIEKLIDGDPSFSLTFGGQQGVVFLDEKRISPNYFPDISHISGRFLKWVLLSPAVFVQHGWAPGWLENTGSRWEVRLKVPLPREKGESRNSWRKRLQSAPFINASLVAACSGKPRAFSGWKEIFSDKGDLKSGPGRTLLAVPAGSVFYFECASDEDALNLAGHLHGKVKSDILGEQGFGLGVCGTWNKE
jgi:CRISPR type III-B/RAMP module-associated protein Cmr3